MAFACLASFSGKPHLVNAGELGACPGAWPRFTDISNEAEPSPAGEFRLAMNREANCPAPNAVEKATGGLVGRAGVATSHFQDVDSPDRTRLGLFTFLFAGLRVVDLTKVGMDDGAGPTEVGYFKPGDPCMSHVHYDARRGNIWLACDSSGFWVISLKPAIQARLSPKETARKR